jgi:hypothetical protein
MTDFDRALANFARETGGLYRRYCDDILFVVPETKQKIAEAFVKDEITKVKLEVQEEKTKRVHFHKLNGVLTASEPLPYLGFLFDGRRTLLRTGSIARYYRKMRSGVSLAAQTKRKYDRLRIEHGESPEPLKRRKLHIRYSYLGRHNFISYALTAAERFKEPAIRAQIKPHWEKFQAEVRKQLIEVSSGL